MAKTIVVTGGSRGIGRAVALWAGDLGWSVGVGHHADRSAAEAVVAAVEEAGGRAVAVAGDVSVEGDVLELFDATERAFGRLHGVVVNAGVVGSAQLARGHAGGAPAPDRRRPRDRRAPQRPRGRTAPRRERRWRGRLHRPGLLRCFAPRRAETSTSTTRCPRERSTTLCLGLAREMAADGVCVNAVRPGVIDTDIHASSGQPDRASRLAPLIPAGRPSTPEEVAQAIVWLLGDAASYTTGALLDVTGGR